MKNCLLILGILICSIASSQSQINRQSVINVTGGFYNHGYFQFEWSIGESTLISHLEDAGRTHAVTNGFLQPYTFYPAVNNTSSQFDISEVRIFPNPATDYVEINITTKQVGRLYMHLYSPTGQKLMAKELYGHGVDIVERLKISHLPQGNYSLQLELVPIEGSVAKKSNYKIIKFK